MKIYPTQVFSYLVVENGIAVAQLGSTRINCDIKKCQVKFSKLPAKYTTCDECLGYIKVSGDRFDIIVPNVKIENDYIIDVDRLYAIRQNLMIELIERLKIDIIKVDDTINNSQQFLLHDIQKVMSSSDVFVEKIKKSEKIVASDLEQLVFHIESLRDIVAGAFEIMYDTFDDSKPPVDVGQIVSRVLRNLKDDSVAKNIEFDVDVQSYNVNSRMGFVAFFEIIRNAIKYSPQSSKLIIYGNFGEPGTNQYEYKLVFGSIGNFVENSNFDNVFSAFWRAPSVEKLHSGTGLGLSRVRYIVEKYLRGKITFEQKGNILEENGRRFRSTLVVITF